jgi:hypothetical protein
MSKVTYTAGGQIYLSDEGRMVYEGEKFEADAGAPIGDNWLDEKGQEIPAEKKRKKGHVSRYSALSEADVKALASARKIPTTGKDKAALIAALAADDADA